MILKLACKNVISRRSSFVIILFISFAVCLFCVANAVFDSTEQGVQENYVSSLTGNLVIRPDNQGQLSLFGDETPVTGELTRIDSLVPYQEIVSYLKSQNQYKTMFSQVSGMTAMEYGSSRTPTYVFGAYGDEYISAMPSITIVKGQPYTAGEKGLMLSSKTAAKIGADIGSVIQFIVTDGPYVRIRAAPLTAIFDYKIHNDIFDRFAIVDPDTVRSLLDMSDSAAVDEIEIEEENTDLLDFTFDSDFDSLFDEVFDAEIEQSDSAPEVFFEEEAPAQEVSSVYIPSTTWNFIVVQLKNSEFAQQEIKRYNRHFKKMGWPVLAVDWRHAAGSTALYLYWMRIIFNIGVGIVLFAGFIIVNNTLVINVLDRTQEIGTIRAIGAGKRFISLQCMAETFMLTITSGIIGVLAGSGICRLITRAHIVLKNSFLIQLFGGSALEVFVTPSNVLKLFILVITLGVIGWIYPVINAVRISPVRAMQGAR